jgi:hypothetical protein
MRSTKSVSGRCCLLIEGKLEEFVGAGRRQQECSLPQGMFGGKAISNGAAEDEWQQG